MTRSARSTWNYLTVVAFSAVTMAVALVVTPILLRYLGEARLGAARAVTDWTGYLSLLELGLGGALMPLLARELTRSDQAGVSGILAAGFRAYTRVAGAMLVGGVGFVLIITRLVKIDPAYHRDLRTATLVAMASLLLMPLSPLRSLVEASQRGYLINLFLIAQSLVIAGFAVTLAKFGWGITGQLLAITIGAGVLGLLLIGVTLLKFRRLLPRHLTRAPEQANRELWRLNTPTLVNNVCGRVGLLTDNIIIGSMLSAGAIVPFFMTQRLAQLAQGQLQSVGSASWAGLAQLHARGEHELFRTRFLELTRLVMMLGLVVLLPIVAYNHIFVRLWVGETQYAGATLTSLAALNAVILALASLWGWVFGGTGQMARLVPLAIASATLNLTVSLGVTWWFAHRDVHRAMWGPVIGTTSAYMLLNIPCLPLLLRKHFGVPMRKLAAAVGGPLVIGAPYGALLIWAASNHPPRGWFSLVAHMGMSALIFAVICWTLLLGPQDRANWKLRLRLASGAGAAAST